MDEEKRKESFDKGVKAEKAFAKYLDDKRIPFYHIDQKKDEFYSEELNTKKIRRPDFIVHTKITLFHIDVKYRTKREFGENKETRFYLDQYTINTLFNLEVELQSQVWIAFIADLDDPVFCYAPMAAIYQYYKDISEIYAEKYPEEYKKYSDLFWIFIPSKILYDNLSYEKGFSKNYEVDFLEKEESYHRYHANKIIDTNKVNWSSIHAHKKQ
jgi:hypothetical protein